MRKRREDFFFIMPADIVGHRLYFRQFNGFCHLNSGRGRYRFVKGSYNIRRFPHIPLIDFIKYKLIFHILFLAFAYIRFF